MNNYSIPVIVDNSKLKKNTKNIFSGCIFFIVGLVFIVVAILTKNSGSEVTDISGLSHTALSTGKNYYISELVLVDEYAHTWEKTESNIVKRHYLVYFYDNSDNLCYASLTVSTDSDLYKTCNDYINDDSLMVGDVILSGCFSSSSFSSEVDGLSTEYALAQKEYYNNGLPGTKTSLNLTYKAKDKTEFSVQNKTVSTVFLCVSILFIILGAVIVVLSLSKRSKIKEEIQNAQNILNSQNSGYIPPQPPYMNM